MAQSVEDALIVRMEASLRTFERQMERALKSAQNSATGSERAWQKAGTQMAANANRAATGLQRITNISGSGRFVIQNTANQIGDLAVQIGSGTSASRALGQQLPQLLGGFGALGGTLGLLGPLLGTAAALAIPLGVAFLATGEKAQSLDDQLKDLSKALDALEAAQKRASTSAVDLVADYGSMADEARALFEIERQMAQIKATAALDTATRGIAGELGVGGVFGFDPEDVRELEAAIVSLKEEQKEALALSTGRVPGTEAEANAAQERIREINDEIKALKSVGKNLDDLAEMLGITEAEAREVAVRFAEIGQADGAAAQAEITQQLVSYIKDVSNNLAEAEGDGKALYDVMVDVAIKMLEASKIEIAGNIGAAADEAARLADNLARALRLNPITPTMMDEDTAMAQQVLPTSGMREQQSSALENFQRLIKPKTGRSGGGGGSGSRTDPRAAEAARIFEQTRTAVEKYAAELENLNQLREAGYLTEDTHMRAVQQLGEEMNKTAGLGQQMGATISDALADMVVNFDNARDAAAGLLQNLAKMVASSAFKSLGLDTLFGSIFPSANGNVFSGGRPVTAFASGGVVSRPTLFPMRGGTGLMGEAGPEAIMPLMRGADGRLGVQAAVGKQQVELIVHADPGVTIEQVRGEAVRIVSAGMAAQDRKTAQNFETYSARRG